MNVLIITGGSNGIGKAIAQKYSTQEFLVFQYLEVKLKKQLTNKYKQI